MNLFTRFLNYLKDRGIPEVILINREAEYHTHYIGKFNNGDQFMFYQTFVFSKPYHTISSNEEWPDFRREYAVQYLFNKEGDLIGHDYLFQGTTSEIDENVEENWIEEKLKSMDEYTFENIKVKPFRVEIDGFEFGLIPNRINQSVDMEPSNTMSFSYPWDGEYYT